MLIRRIWFAQAERIINLANKASLRLRFNPFKRGPVKDNAVITFLTYFKVALQMVSDKMRIEAYEKKIS